MLLVFQFYLVCNFGKFINFRLGTVRGKRVNNTIIINVRIKTKGDINHQLHTNQLSVINASFA